MVTAIACDKVSAEAAYWPDARWRAASSRQVAVRVSISNQRLDAGNAASIGQAVQSRWMAMTCSA